MWDASFGCQGKIGNMLILQLLSYLIWHQYWLMSELEMKCLDNISKLDIGKKSILNIPYDDTSWSVKPFQLGNSRALKLINGPKIHNIFTWNVTDLISAFLLATQKDSNCWICRLAIISIRKIGNAMSCGVPESTMLCVWICCESIKCRLSFHHYSSFEFILNLPVS